MAILSRSGGIYKMFHHQIWVPLFVLIVCCSPLSRTPLTNNPSIDHTQHQNHTHNTTHHTGTFLSRADVTRMRLICISSPDQGGYLILYLILIVCCSPPSRTPSHRHPLITRHTPYHHPFQIQHKSPRTTHHAPHRAKISSSEWSMWGTSSTRSNIFGINIVWRMDSLLSLAVREYVGNGVVMEGFIYIVYLDV